MIETQESIYNWQLATFGHADNIMRSATRINEEVAELLVHISINQIDKVGSEIADIFILLCGLASRLDLDLQEEVDKKMVTNRARKWGPVIDGHAYHIKGEPQ